MTARRRSDGEAVLFQEVQRFRQKWVWIVVLGGVLVSALTLSGALSSEGSVGWLVAGFSTAVTVAICWLLHAARLTTTVTPAGLFVRFFPFHWSEKRISLEDAVSAKAETYRPIREFGGWGIRVGIRKKAYNVSGNRGVRLTFADGRVLVIGSERAEQLASALRQTGLMAEPVQQQQQRGEGLF